MILDKCKFIIEHIIVAEEGLKLGGPRRLSIFKLLRIGIANIYQSSHGDSCGIGDLRSVGRFQKEMLGGNNRVPDNGE